MTSQPRHLVIRDEAEADLAEALRWYEARSAGLGESFVAAVDACLAEITRQPELHPQVHGRARRALLRRFPYAMFYLIQEESIDVVACFHMRRDPRRWQARLTGGP
jgi:toxin ParE1/3/4